MKPLDLTTIILSYNEELHIRRCLENVSPISKRVLVIDCFSTDTTCEICKSFPNVEVVQHAWPGDQATQYNWAIDTIPIDTAWILRIDADEYLLPELVEELIEKLPALPEDVTGIELKRRHIFMGKWVKHGIYPVIMLRICRTGCGRYEPRLMDEHYVLTKGHSIVLDNDFCDHSLITLSEYCNKHVKYAQREAVEILDSRYGLKSTTPGNEGLGEQARKKRSAKSRYNKMPLFWRSFAYFLYRFIFRGGFLDGKEGFLFAFIQGWFYRTMVDADILEVKKACGGDREKMKLFIKDKYGISL